MEMQTREDQVGSWNDSARVDGMMKRWGKFVEGAGCKNNGAKRLLAILADNQLQHLGRINEETTSANVGSFTKYIFPTLRRVVPNLIAPEIVSVQPMMAPVGGIFTREAKYGTTKGSITAGDNIFSSFDEEYSSERVTGELLATGNGVDYGGAGAALNTQVSSYPVRPLNTANGFSFVIAEYNGATVTQTATDNGAGGFTGNTTAGTINYQTGQISGFLFTNAVANTKLVKATYQYNMELNSRVPDVNMEVTLDSIIARPRKLKGTWSPEAVEDFRQLQGIDAESDLTITMAQEMGLEIDREILTDLLSYAASGAQATYDRAVTASDATEMDAIRRLLTPMSDVSNRIWKSTKRGQANFAVTSTEMISTINLLSSHGDYMPALIPGQQLGGDPSASIVVPSSFGPTTSDFGIRNVGVVSSKWNMYVDPFFTSTKMLMGLKGKSYLDAGYVFSPYVMFMVTPSFYDPRDFSFRKGIRSRYAKKRLRPEWYGVITASNLTLV